MFQCFYLLESARLVLQFQISQGLAQRDEKDNNIPEESLGLLSAKLVLNQQYLEKLSGMENEDFEDLENHSDSESDVEIPAYSKSDSKANVMAILEETIEIAVERALPCNFITSDENMSVGYIPRRRYSEEKTQEISQTPSQNLRESMPYLFLVFSIVLAITGHLIFGGLAFAAFGALKFLPEDGPGERAYPSNQKEFLTCTRHALGKAIVDGFQDGTFCEGREVNFDQEEVIEALENIHKEPFKSKYPTAFTHRKFIFMDQDSERSRYFEFILNVETVKRNEVINDMYENLAKPSYKYVLSYRTPKWIQKILDFKFLSTAHCVFVEKLDPPKGRNPWIARCINSYGPVDSYPGIPMDQKYNEFYRVDCRVLSTSQIVHDIFTGGDRERGEPMEIDQVFSLHYLSGTYF